MIPWKVHKLSLVLVAIVLLYDYRDDIFTPSITVWCSKNEQNFTLLTPYSVAKNYSTSITYRRLIDIVFSFKINQRVCSTEPFLLIILVPSSLSNFEQRLFIRNTWGRTNDVIKIVFTMGVNDDDEIMAKVMKESNLYKDIVQGDFFDSYHNLTYKHIMGLKWVTHHCPTARYIVKADDDNVVNCHELTRFLSRQLSPWGIQSLIAGLRYEDMQVLRSNETRWFVSNKDYAPDFFPTYCSGTFILYSQDVVPLLVEASETTKYLFIEDAYATGIVAEKVGVSRSDISYLYLRLTDITLLMKYGITLTKPFLFGPVNLYIEDQRSLWKMISVDN